MKKVILLMLVFAFVVTSCNNTKTKDDYKKEILAKREAMEEIKSEDLDREIKQLDAMAATLPKSQSEKTMETSENQKKIMDNDKGFFFDKEFSEKDKYKIKKHFKFNLSTELSEVNGQYKLYQAAKEINAVGVVNYKVSYEPFYVSGDAVVEK